MLSVADARAAVLRLARPLPPLRQPPALGLVLAAPVAADRDAPPFTKSLMDGYATRAAELPGVFRVTEEIAAGSMPTRPIGPGEAARIMTGAPMPAGADVVVMVERSRLLSDGRVELGDAPAVGKNVLPQGREMRAGDVILAPGRLLRPQELGLLAAVGCTNVLAHSTPHVGLVATGSELVEAGAMPGPGQIRNSNGPMLAAQIARAGGIVTNHGIAADVPELLRAKIAAALRAPLVVLAGGVSMGTLDLVPAILQELGVTPVFHKVAMKPGKPLFFGTHGDTLVFGLPGNPVSAYVGFELFVRPALHALRGLPPLGPSRPLPLAADLTTENDRPTYLPARRENNAVRAVPWFGSADLRGLADADVLLELPAGKVELRAGELVNVLESGE